MPTNGGLPFTMHAWRNCLANLGCVLLNGGVKIDAALRLRQAILKPGLILQICASRERQ